jgi:hypothetical protein
MVLMAQRRVFFQDRERIQVMAERARMEEFMAVALTPVTG